MGKASRVMMSSVCECLLPTTRVIVQLLGVCSICKPALSVMYMAYSI